MGARYLKIEDTVIEVHYPTATRAEILELIPNRTWGQIGVHARNKGIHRTSKARGNSVREGRKSHKDAWTDQQNELFDALYPKQTREQLLAAFPNRSWLALQSHAQKRSIHRTPEAIRTQIYTSKVKMQEKKKKFVIDEDIVKEVSKVLQAFIDHIDADCARSGCMCDLREDLCSQPIREVLYDFDSSLCLMSEGEK